SGVHGLAGSLLRALVAADIPDPVFARRVVRAAARGRRRTSVAALARRGGSAARDGAAGTGARIQRAFRQSARARGHAQPDARLDARAQWHGVGVARILTRDWVPAHLPAGPPSLVEPVAPNGWGTLWNKYPSLI